MKNKLRGIRIYDPRFSVDPLYTSAKSDYKISGRIYIYYMDEIAGMSEYPVRHKGAKFEILNV